MCDTTTIIISDLHKTYGQVHAIAGISQQIDGGQIFGLLGPNWAGKTTLIRLLIGSTKTTSGIILPVEQLPEWVQILSYSTPLIYANEVLKELIGGGLLLDDWQLFAALPAYGLAVIVAATFSLRELD